MDRSDRRPSPRLPAQRRDARRAENRADILDAAERVFGEHGIRGGSLRQIANSAGFSTAAIYLFFDNKQHLLSETLSRLWTEINALHQETANSDLSPFSKIHALVDVTGVFFERRPHFLHLMHEILSRTAVEPALAEYIKITDARFSEALSVVSQIIREGQVAGEIREGDPDALALFYAVLVNQHFLSAAGEQAGVKPLTIEQFHALLDGALRTSPLKTGR